MWVSHVAIEAIRQTIMLTVLEINRHNSFVLLQPNIYTNSTLLSKCGPATTFLHHFFPPNSVFAWVSRPLCGRLFVFIRAVWTLRWVLVFPLLTAQQLMALSSVLKALWGCARSKSKDAWPHLRKHFLGLAGGSERRETQINMHVQSVHVQPPCDCADIQQSDVSCSREQSTVFHDFKNSPFL